MSKLVLNKDEFERVLFKTLIKDPSAMGLLSDFMTPEVFTKKEWQACMDFYLKFYREHTKLPTASEMKMFMKPETFETFVRVWQSPEIQGTDHGDIEPKIFYDEAEKFLKERHAMLEIVKIVDGISKKGMPEASELVATFEKVASINVMRERGFDIYKDVDKFISSSAETGERISTGFFDLDNEIGGGVPSDGKFLGVIAAPPNMGKSIMLGNLAVNAVKRGKNVLLISLEMSEKVYAARIYSALYDLPISEISLLGNDIKAAISENKSYGSMLIKEFPPASMTVEQLDGFIDSLRKLGMKFDLIVVDYLTLISAPRAENSNDAGKIVSRKLRALTYRYDTPLWAACQINREGMGSGVPDMRFIAESIAIAAEADLIAGLFQQEEDVENEIMRVWLMKSRLGRNNVGIALKFNRRSLKFEDATGEMVEAQQLEELINQNIPESATGTSSVLSAEDIFGTLGINPS